MREIAELQYSIQHRGQADIAGAREAVDTFLTQVVLDAGVAGNADAWVWVHDRMRYFMAVSFMNFFGILDHLPNELPALNAEYRSILNDEKQFGPEHIVAWWWLLQPSLFKPPIANQFVEMRGALTDLTRAVAETGGDYAGQMVDWAGWRETFMTG